MTCLPIPSRTQRLFVETDLAAGAPYVCTAEQAKYLGAVLRLSPGDPVLLFNGRDGEWLAEVAERSKRAMTLAVTGQTRQQQDGPDIAYLFAPLKHARLDYMVQKATEMGVARLRPIITRYTNAERVNLERMHANAVEAAEQCGILRIPEVRSPENLAATLAAWDPARRLIFCDESAPIADPVAALQAVPSGPLAVLIGPEGGFSEDEREALIAAPFTVRVALGPRILRADTAAVAVLALVGAVLGDWRG